MESAKACLRLTLKVCMMSCSLVLHCAICFDLISYSIWARLAEQFPIIALQTWILPRPNHHALSSGLPHEKPNTSKPLSPLLVESVHATRTIDQPQDQPIWPLLGSSPPCLEWDGDTPVLGHLSPMPSHPKCSQEDNLPSNPFGTSSSLFLDSYSTILDEDFLSLFDSSFMKHSLLPD